MTPRDFSVGMMRGVVDENVAIYRDLFNETSPQDAIDPYWQRALALFGSLNPDQREVFFEVIRQASIDMTSNLLGVLDGVNTIEGIDSGLVVMDATGRRLNGDLQSYFLVEDEGKAR
jgi:hypothetical protein